MRGLLLDVEQGVAHVRMNRPDVGNAMGAGFWREFPAQVRELDARGDVRCLVLSGEGRHFSTGMDLAVFMSPDAPSPRGPDPALSAEAFRRLIMQLQDTFSCLEDARFPVLAAVQGACVGAGVDMISACDMRYASANAFFQVQEINIGMTADVGTFPRLCRLMPEGRVRELAYTGGRLRAKSALELGLLNAVFDTPEALIEGVLRVAREIASKSPLAVAGSKRMMNYARDHSTRDALDYVATWNAAMFSPEHMAEAFRAQQEKRTPGYPDLKPEAEGL
jgi:enoyl-CoA hydratase